MHQIFGNIGDLDSKSLGASETLVSEVYAGCNGPRSVHTHGLYEDRGMYSGWNDEELCLRWCQALG
jgi:hypothetical protein